MTASRQVLIAGAGPTGLVLALALHRCGVAVRIVDEDPGPGDASRAIVVQARTLELYDQFGIAEAAVARGIVLSDVRIREQGREIAGFDLRRLGEGLSPYPFALILPQDDHERFLVEVLAREGVIVERDTRLSRFEQDAAGVRAVLVKDGVEEVCEAAWLCGCDGARSQVRKGLGIEFPGGTYEQPFYVADVKIAGDFRTDLSANLGAGGLAMMFPVRSSGMQRLIGNLPPDGGGDVARLTFEDVRQRAESLLGITVERVNWFAAYRVHHRVAARFRVGRVFLAGDAGHIHSPAGGQGMNTGIGDAVNLAWRLADVLRGRAPEELLDGYEAERLAFARKLVETTDRAFRGMVDTGPAGRFLRTWLAPRALPRVLRLAAARRLLFKTVSQTAVSYRDSGDGEGRAGRVHAGDRLPWVGGETENYAPLRSADWQAHVYGQASGGLKDEAARQGLPLHAFPWSAAAARAGLLEDAIYLIRPDGHVDFASAEQDQPALQALDARIRRRQSTSTG